MTSTTVSMTTQTFRTWVEAVRPKTLTASVVPVMVGTAVSFALLQGALDITLSIYALLSATCIQIGTNLFNDVIDFERGADTVERLGPTRATQSGALTKEQVYFGAYASFFLAVFFGALLVLHGGWPILLIGIVSLVCGYAYTGGPFPLAYRGLGDVFVLAFFGIIAVMGTTYLHLHTWNREALVAGLQVGCHAVVLIAINNLRDIEGDALAQKKTIAVRFGEAFARTEIVALSLLPYLLGGFWLLHNYFLAGVLPLVLLPLTLALVRKVYITKTAGSALNRCLGLSAAQHALFGTLLTIGLLFTHAL